LNLKHLFKFRKLVPVLIIERIQVGRRFGVFRKHTNKLLFLGRLPVMSILMVGFWRYMLWFGGINYSEVQNELFHIFMQAKLDDMAYRVVDFFEKGQQLIIYVIRKG
jgi:hypothetical protein